VRESRYGARDGDGLIPGARVQWRKVETEGERERGGEPAGSRETARGTRNVNRCGCRERTRRGVGGRTGGEGEGRREEPALRASGAERGTGEEAAGCGIERTEKEAGGRANRDNECNRERERREREKRETGRLSARDRERRRYAERAGDARGQIEPEEW